jgi:hypothetical protein
MKMLDPIELNAVARFCMSPDDVLSQFLDDPESMVQMAGRHSLSSLKGDALCEAGGIIEAFRDGCKKSGIVIKQALEDVSDNSLQGQRLAR